LKEKALNNTKIEEWCNKKIWERLDFLVVSEDKNRSKRA